MRAHLAVALTILAAPVLRPVAAQGWIVPRPCILPVGAPSCRDGVCRPMPPRSCPVGSTIERTSSLARAELVGRVVRWEIDETFINRGALLAEADYVFPLPNGAAFED